MVVPPSSKNTEPKFNESDMELNLKVPTATLNTLSEGNSVNEIDKKLENVTSPQTFFTYEEESLEQSITSYESIPIAHGSYEVMLRKLENDCRNHIKCE